MSQVICQSCGANLTTENHKEDCPEENWRDKMRRKPNPEIESEAKRLADKSLKKIAKEVKEI